MSFALTQDQILNQTKTVTRRNGWKFIKPGDDVQPVNKCMGFKKGEKPVKLGPPIHILSVSSQRLHQITKSDLIKEGFPDMTKEEFIKLYCKANKCDRNAQVTRIEFEYLPF